MHTSKYRASQARKIFFCLNVYCLLFVLFTNVNAQQDGLGEYHFRLMKAREGSSFNDTTINITSNCLAANGYGQWTLSSSTGSPSRDIQNGWFLLPNYICENSLVPPVPPGVVASGIFVGAFPIATSKVTCNLVGQVRYVGLDFTNSTTASAGFVVQGLNDQRGTSGNMHIDINKLGQPNPPLNRQVVKQIIQSFTNASTTVGATAHTIVPLSTEADYRDAFDVACDEYFLYIVWRSDANVLAPSTSEIWATAIDINTGTVATGFPIKVSMGTNMVADNGVRPTVACDVRHNSTTTPKFDVAYISNGRVIVREFSGTTIFSGHSVVLQKKFHDPFNPTNPPSDHLYNTATHARVLVSSVSTSSNTTHSVYVLDDFNATLQVDHDLIFYKGLNWTGTEIASYVDGSFDNGATVVFPTPIPGSVTQAVGVADKHIIAFINPYDNQDLTNGYIQFHCLYQPLVNSRFPLFLARSADVNFVAPASDSRVILSQDAGSLLSDPINYVGAVNQMGIHVHWRTSLSGVTTHYYSRDIMRTIDEDIEENTLVTSFHENPVNLISPVYVKNGTSHGGSATPTILRGITMTLWTDPNFIRRETLSNLANTVTFDGAFTIAANGSSFEGTLLFEGDDVVLKVGDNAGSNPLGATLLMMPNTNCTFPLTYANQGITIQANSVFDYYAYGPLGYGVTTKIDGTTQFPNANPNRSIFVSWPANASPFRSVDFGSLGNGTIKLLGKTSGGNIIRAVLNLHGGCQFNISGFGSFIADKADIESLFESQVYPTWFQATTPQGADYFPAGSSDYMNAPAPGKMNLQGVTSITNTIINSYDADVSSTDKEFDDIITILGNSGVITPVTISNCVFSNLGTTWLGSSTFNGNSIFQGLSRLVLLKLHSPLTFTTTLPEVNISNCNFDSWQLAAYNPENPVSINQCSFDNIRSAAINLQRDLAVVSPISYDNISIVGCDFKTYRVNSSLNPSGLSGLIPSSKEGIYVAGFSNSLMHGNEGDIIYFPRILIEGNTFTTTTVNSVEDAIYLENSNVSVLTNQISKSGYNNGITNVSSTFPATETTTFLCSNIISNVAFDGILTDHWKGYSKLNNVSACAVGHLSSNDKTGAGVVFCNYHENIGAGLELIAASIIDMSGVHSGGNNYPGDNTISLNNTSSASSTAQIKLATGTTLKIGTSSTTYTTYGHNNIICNSTSDKLIFAPSGGTYTLGGVEDNYWGYGTSPTSIQLFGASNAAFMPNITYTPAGTDPNYNTSKFSFSGVSCGNGFDAKQKGRNEGLLSYIYTLDLSSSECARLQDVVGSLAQGNDNQKTYDTARYAIEHCASQNVFPAIWTDFGAATGAVQYLNNDNNRWPIYRDWLKKVLYLNSDTSYYCQDVDAILTTFQYFNSERGYDRNGALAVVKFLIDSNRCLSLYPNINKVWKNTRDQQYQTWRDTVKDQAHSRLDTTLPALEDLDLGILRGPQFGAVVNGFTPSSMKKINSVTASKNPFDDETTLIVDLNDDEYMKLEVYDLLGNKLYTDSKLFIKGKNRWNINSNIFPHTELYARVSTMGGDVVTVKLLHQ